jgi:hypothetical protein
VRRSDEVEAQSRSERDRCTFYEVIKIGNRRFQNREDNGNLTRFFGEKLFGMDREE